MKRVPYIKIDKNYEHPKNSSIYGFLDLDVKIKEEWGTDIEFFCWISGGNSTCARFIPIQKRADFVVSFNFNRTQLYAGVYANKHAEDQQMLILVGYQKQEAEDSDEQYILLFSTAIDLSASIGDVFELRNDHLKCSMNDYGIPCEKEDFTMGEATVTLITNKYKGRKLQLEPYSNWSYLPFLRRFKMNQVVFSIQKPLVGATVGWYPRECFYVRPQDRVDYTDRWLYAQFHFQIRLAGMEEEDFIKGVSDLLAAPEYNAVAWAKYMDCVCEGVTRFITRMPYTKDAIHRGNEVIDFENFSDRAYAIGCADCEDGAFSALSIYASMQTKAKDLKGYNKYPLLSVIYKMLDLYIPVNGLVNASVPNIITGDTKVEGAKDSFYHEACLLIDKHMFLQTVYPKEEKKRFYTFPDSIPEWTKYEHTLCCETTTDVLPDPEIPDLSLTDRFLNLILSVVGMNKQPLAIPTGRNYKRGSDMYNYVIQLSTGFFIDNPPSNKPASIMFEVIDDNNECGSCRVDKLNGHIVAVSDPDVTQLLQNQNIKDLMSLAMPPPKLDLDVNRYWWATRKIKFGTGIKWGYIDETKEGGIPFLPWNLTFENDTQQLRQLFIHPIA
jgi:hypothetical protein